MAKDKERTLNPAQAQRKLEKQRALKKGKAEALARRNEKLARRNPDRIQRQIDDIKAIEQSGQPLRPREKQMLEELERDLRAVKKAREALGDKAPKFESRRGPPQNDRGRGDSVLGKRRRDGHGQWRQESESSDTDESVRDIPMPRDTPPPIPRRRRDAEAEAEALEEGGERKPHALPPKPPAPEVKTVYEAAPAIRNLRQEAVSKFVPAAVRMKQEAIKGQGKLLEPEEMDRLEKAGYVAGAAPPKSQEQNKPAASVDEAKLAEEEERFNRELKSVQIEEVEDEER
ncbi:hypothetical protein VTN00DRAFT_8891 [Thermoascus crustaceus]|uniref:uncharacterized protein n=1 Tax=Thermoascus crustaceus TaxID=5088 RepID=UPI003742B0D7